MNYKINMSRINFGSQIANFIDHNLFNGYKLSNQLIINYFSGDKLSN